VTYDPTIKIVAKPDTWFKAGTEVLVAYGPKPYKRITFRQLYDMINEECLIRGDVFSGIRIVDADYEVSAGYKKGEERLDEELCGWEEFTFEMIDLDDNVNT